MHVMKTASLSLSIVLAAVLAVAGCRAAGPNGAQDASQDSANASRELISTVTGDPPNFAQMANGNMMTVVSRGFGRGAKTGALVELFWPAYSTDHLWDSYIGVVGADGKPTWAHDLKLVKQALAPDTGRALTLFQGPGYTLAIEDVMAPGSDVHLRRATVTNTTGQPLSGLALANFGFYTIGSLPTGDRARFEDGTLIQSEAATTIAVAADVAPDATRLGNANIPLGGSRDARQAVEGGDWQGGPAAVGPAVAGVDAVTRHPLPTLAPGATAAVTWAIAIGTGSQAPRDTARAAAQAGFDVAASSDATKWKAFLAAAKMPQGLGSDTTAVYRRALLTLGQHQTNEGAIIAAPTNMNPPYRFVWPRDGSLIALTFLEAGHRAAAEKFFTFAEKLQRPDGSFAINYFPDGQRALWDFGPTGNEHDQPGTFVWAIDRVFAKTGDRAWLGQRWPAVRRSCEFLAAVQEQNGLLSACRDLWELDSDGSWTYSNGAAWAGLMAGAAIAERMGAPADAARWRGVADRLKIAIGEKLKTGATGFLGRGLRGGKVDPTIEAANLALGAGAFNVFSDRDPILLATGQAVIDKLTMPGGGIRRYEADRYYDGQPWPVSTAWLATHQLALGDKAAARQGLDTMTRWAGATDALMLGEQFDEGKKRWASAFPLAWSEAVYVRLSLDLAK